MQTGQYATTAAGSSHWLSGNAAEGIVVGAVAEMPEVTHRQEAEKKKKRVRKEEEGVTESATVLSQRTEKLQLDKTKDKQGVRRQMVMS